MTKNRTTTSTATVYLVGAGPGDPGLVTLRAVECLGRADLVLYDYLVNPATLEHAALTAELIGLGHHSFGRALSQDEINTRMIEAAQQGKTVVRLKGGDPSVFGRGADEIGALRAASVPFEIVPAVTAGLAVAAYCEIPITHHDDASAVALIAGQERHCKKKSCLDYGVLAEFPGTLIFYMGVRSSPQWSQALIENGKRPETPIAIVRRCTWPLQQMVRCTLGTVVEVIEEKKIRPPALFVVGPVVDRVPPHSWFSSRPLFGTSVLVAGSPGTSSKLRDRLASLGANAIVQPAIRITEPEDWAPVDDALNRLDRYDWVIFTSNNGVDSFFNRLIEQGGDARRLGGVKLAAVGPATAERLTRFHLHADCVPERFNAEALAERLATEADGQRFLLAAANRGRTVLADTLRQSGAQVDRVVVYDSVDVDVPNPDVAESLETDQIDWVTVTSPATARSLVRLYGDALHHAQLISISPLTSTALREIGYEPTREASQHTTSGLIDTILKFEHR